MRRLLATWVPIVCVAAIVGAAGVGAASVSSRPTAAEAAKVARAKVTVHGSAYGRVLFDGRNRALYVFTADRNSKSRCYRACARAWPPFLVRRRPAAGSGADAKLIGTTRRSDGSVQATYRGRPLYYYVGDGRGQILCQDVEEYGGHWYVVAPRGTAVR
jgi:predicted lipoprotein with Yx(FWY)xxD motif